MTEPINSVLHLLANIDLDNNYEHTIDFETKAAQDTYFDSKVTSIIPEEDYSYIKQNENIKVFSPIDSLIGINYLYYNNSGKRYYCFITDKKYINDETTELIIQEDVIQTYMFDYDLDECFIDREHEDRFTDDRRPIYDEIQENLNYGTDYDSVTEEVPIMKLDNRHEKTQVLFLYILCSKHIIKDEPDTESPIFIDNGVLTGYCTYCLPLAENGTLLKYKDSNGTVHDLLNMSLINSIPGLKDKIFHNPLVQMIFLSPFPPARMDIGADDLTLEFFAGEYLMRAGYEDLGGANRGLICLYERFKHAGVSAWPLVTVEDNYPDLPQSISVDDTYSEIEPKTYVYPYHMKKVIYGNNELEVKAQKKEIHSIYLQVFQSLSDEATSLVNIEQTYNVGYKAQDEMYTLTNNMPAFLNISTDLWQKYMLEHKAQREAGFNTARTSAAISIVSGVASGNALGWLSAGSSIASNKARIDEVLAKEEDIKNQPDDIRQFNGDLSQMLATGNINIKIRTLNARPVFVHRLAKYFHYYGYKVNDLRVPNTKSRYNFNYLKNIDTNIKCKDDKHINHDILNKLKEIYNNGITFWHYHTGFKGIREYNNNNYEVKFLQGETQQ